MSPASARVVLEESTLGVSSRGVVTGVIFVLADGNAFPERKWNDFLERVLGSWADELVPALSGHRRHITLPFMDGPFELQVELGPSPDRATLTACGGGRREPLFRIDSALRELAESVLLEGRRLQAWTAERTCDTTDGSALAGALVRLEARLGDWCAAHGRRGAASDGVTPEGSDADD